MSKAVAVPKLRMAAFLLALSVLTLLIVVNILTLQARTRSQRSAAAVVNVSGRQRMLSQRMALLAQNLLRAGTSGERADILEELASAMALFEQSHRGLTAGDPEMGLPGDLPSEVHAIYFESPVRLDEQVQRYLTSLKSLAEMPDAQLAPAAPSLQIIWATATQRQLLDGLDAAVAAFQTDSEAKVGSLEKRIWWVFAGTLLTAAIAFALAVLIVVRTQALEEAHRDGLRMLEDVENARQEAEQAEREARASEAKLLAIVNTAVDGIITINERGMMESVNPAAGKLFGYAPGELLGRNVNVLMPPPWSDEHDGYIRRYVETGENRIIDTRLDVTGKRNDGTTFPLELAVSCVQLDDRRLFTGIVRDLTERRRAEQQLRLSAEIMENLAEGVNLVRDSDDAVVYTNPRFDEMFGYEPGELIGQQVTILNAPGDKSPEETAAEIVRELERQGSWSGEVHNVRKDGTLFRTYCNVSSLELAQYGRVWITVQTDITERKRAEEDLRESEERFKTLVESSQDGILMVDVAGTIVVVNAEAERMFGYAHEELIGQSIGILVPDPDRQSHPQNRPAFLKEPLDPLQGARFEFQGRRKDGHEFPLELGLKSIELADGTFVITTVRDLTERKRLQREFAVARDIQVALLPKEPPSIPGFEITASCWPAESTGGDFYDFIRVDDPHLRIVIGDVSGHGFGPAILASGTHAYLKAVAKTQPVLSAMMETTNQLLCEDTGDSRFVTSILVVIDVQNRTLNYVNAGHVEGLIFDRAGTVKQRLRSTAMPLGILADQRFPLGQSAKLEAGDTVLLLTDGFQDTMADTLELFGGDRVVSCVQSYREKSGREILDGLYRAVAEFRKKSPQQDDLTGVVVKVL